MNIKNTKPDTVPGTKSMFSGNGEDKKLILLNSSDGK